MLAHELVARGAVPCLVAMMLPNHSWAEGGNGQRDVGCKRQQRTRNNDGEKREGEDSCEDNERGPFFFILSSF